MAARDRTAGSGGTGLSADRAVAAVRVHVDRVHDAVLRTGCAPADAVDVVRTTALALVERAAGEPSPADRAVGLWFADAQAAGRAAVGASPPGLPGDADQQQLQAALDRLPERQRLAVLLHDAYDLPLGAVAAALGTDVASAEQVVGDGRDALPSPDALAGLSVLAMAPAARSAVLREVEDLAHRRLPPARPGPGSRQSTALAAPAGLPEDPPPRLLSPLLAGLSVVLAVLAGIGVGLVLARQDAPRTVAADGALPPGVAFVTPRPSVTAVPSPPTVAEVRPRTDVVVISPSPLPTPTPTPTPSPTPTAVPTLALSPASGGGGTTIAVTGTGFAPGDQVRIDLLDAEGVATGSSAVAVADDQGSISASVVVQDPPGEPGPRTVTATVADATDPVASADFTVRPVAGDA